MPLLKKLLFFWLVGLLFVTNAQALEVQPVRYTVVADPGEEQILRISVRNNESGDRVFTMRVKGATQDESGRTVVESEKDSAVVDWISANPATFSLKPGESREVMFTVKVPANERPGTRLLTLIAEARSGATISSQAGVVVALTVAGLVNEVVQIKRWEPNTVWSTQSNRVFDLTLENLGNVEVELQGTVVTSDWRNNELTTAPLPLGNRLQPGSTRRLSVPVTFTKKRALFGWYKAKVVVRFGAQNQIIADSKTIYFCSPWILAAGFLILLGALAVWGARGYKKRRYEFQ